MKICSCCGFSKEDAEFYSKGNQCKICVNLKRREYERRPEIKAKKSAYNKKYKIRMKRGAHHQKIKNPLNDNGRLCKACGKNTQGNHWYCPDCHKKRCKTAGDGRYLSDETTLQFLQSFVRSYL